VKTDPDLPSDIGPYKKPAAEPERVPRRPLPGTKFASKILFPAFAALMFVMVTAPLFGLVAGVTVNLLVHWYEIGMSI